MQETVRRDNGWKPIPLPLKILFVVFVFWLVGTAMNFSNLFENGMPLFGTFVYGIQAIILPLLLDIVGPITFLFALWARKSWAAYWAFVYNGIFIVNNAVAFFTVRDQLGLPQILAPTIVSIAFCAVIFWQRGYFKPASTL